MNLPNWKSNLLNVVTKQQYNNFSIDDADLDHLLIWLARFKSSNDEFTTLFLSNFNNPEQAIKCIFNLLDTSILKKPIDHRRIFGIYKTKDFTTQRLKFRYALWARVFHPDRNLIDENWLTPRMELINGSYKKVLDSPSILEPDDKSSKKNNRYSSADNTNKKVNKYNKRDNEIPLKVSLSRTFSKYFVSLRRYLFIGIPLLVLSYFVIIFAGVFLEEDIKSNKSSLALENNPTHDIPLINQPKNEDTKINYDVIVQLKTKLVTKMDKTKLIPLKSSKNLDQKNTAVQINDSKIISITMDQYLHVDKDPLKRVYPLKINHNSTAKSIIAIEDIGSPSTGAFENSQQNNTDDIILNKQLKLNKAKSSINQSNEIKSTQSLESNIEQAVTKLNKSVQDDSNAYKLINELPKSHWAVVTMTYKSKKEAIKFVEKYKDEFYYLSISEKGKIKYMVIAGIDPTLPGAIKILKEMKLAKIGKPKVISVSKLQEFALKH